jgi:hypothetical protein
MCLYAASVIASVIIICHVFCMACMFVSCVVFVCFCRCPVPYLSPVVSAFFDPMFCSLSFLCLFTLFVFSSFSPCVIIALFCGCWRWQGMAYYELGIRNAYPDTTQNFNHARYYLNNYYQTKDRTRIKFSNWQGLVYSFLWFFFSCPYSFLRFHVLYQALVLLA